MQAHAGKEVSARLPIIFNGLNYVCKWIGVRVGGHRANLDVFQACPRSWPKHRVLDLDELSLPVSERLAMEGIRIRVWKPFVCVLEVPKLDLFTSRSPTGIY